MQGVWLIQLGSPEQPTALAVRRYLNEFLTDPHMIELPAVLRQFLVRGIISPLRARKSAKAYKSIWRSQGSPLSIYSFSLREKLQKELGPSYVVELGMRYGKPSLEYSWNKLKEKKLERVFVIPLFPQYSKATTGSVQHRISEVLGKESRLPEIEFLAPFFNRQEFIECFANRAKKLNLENFDHFLFSYHGLPESFIKKSCSSFQNNYECCDRLHIGNQFCYRAHCSATTRGIIKHLHLNPDSTSMSFQSRLGWQKWIQPYTSEHIQELASKGIKRLAVFCPSFVADCLETLEEIGIRGRESFLKAGGKDFQLVPSLNDEFDWVFTLASWIRT